MAEFYGGGDLILSGFNQRAYDLKFTGHSVLNVSSASGIIAERIEGDIEAGGTDLTFNDINGDLTVASVATNLRAEGINGSVSLTGVTGGKIQMRSDFSFGTALTLVGCTDIIADVQIATPTTDAVFVDGGSDIKVTGRVNDAVIFDSVTNGTIDIESDSAPATAVSIINGSWVRADVAIFFPDNHGVVVNGGSDIVVTGQIIEAGQAAANTYDNIQLTGSTATPRVSDVTLRSGLTSARNGILIDTGVTDAIYDAVDAGVATSYGTATVTDNGTNTRVGTLWST